MRMKKKISIVLAMALFALSMLLIVMPVNAVDYPFNITDSAGRDVTIQMPITRIIVLNNDAAEAVKVLGEVDNIVGVVEGIKTKKSYYFPELVNTQSVGKWSNPDLEEIIAIAANNTEPIVPDILVIQYVYSGKSYGIDPLIERFENDFPNITVVGFDFYTQDTMCEEMDKLGVILDREDEADAYISWREGKETEVANGIADIEPISRDELSNAILSYLRTTYLGEAVEHLELNRLRRYAWFHSYGPTPWVFIESTYKGLGDISSRGPGSGDHSTCLMAGGYNIVTDLGEKYPHVEWEWVLAQNPDVIIKGVRTTPSLGWDSIDDPKEVVDGIKSRAGAENIFAVENSRVYAFCAEPLYGLDNVVGLVYWAKLIHPELNLNPEEVYEVYLTTFMNMSYPAGRVFVYPAVE